MVGTLLHLPGPRFSIRNMRAVSGMLIKQHLVEVSLWGGGGSWVLKNGQDPGFCPVSATDLCVIGTAYCFSLGL